MALPIRDDAVNIARSGSRALRLAALIVSALFLIVVALACVSMFWRSSHVDFLSYWAAGRLVLQGHPAAAYDLEAHRAVETAVIHKFGLIPFPYPPGFLFIVTPFALLPLASAFAIWLIVTVSAYLVCIRHFAAPAEALAHPAVLANGLIGQNGFLTTAIFAGGMSLLRRSPVAAGLVLGLLSYKPQLALLVPIALAAGREWKALAATVVAGCALWVCALAVFGSDAYFGFLRMLPRYAEFVRTSRWSWGELASPFAFVRFLGAPQGLALAIHALVACGAIAVVCRLWWRKADGRAAALAAGTLLIPPYLFTYDALLLVVALGWLVERDCLKETVVAWLLCLLPVAASFGLYSGPNTIPLAAIFCLVTIDRISSTKSDWEQSESEAQSACPPSHSLASMRPATR